ncbi:MAG TPA: cytochrome P450, partial [Acidimicrobiia bacterium]|nr:cytochrome P450 [Acidimicrobiia bacterium]
MTQGVSPAADCEAGLPVFPMARAPGCPFDPPPALREAQRRGPISRMRLWDGSAPWVVTGHREQRALLSDPRLSADATRPGYPHVSPGMAERRRDARNFIAMDDPDHLRLRRLVTAPFTVKRVEAIRPAIQAIVDRFVEGLAAGPRPVDLVASFALPIPSLVICELLGVPYADHDFFQCRSATLLRRDAAPAVVLAAQREIVGYLERLVAIKRADPADDLLSRVATDRVAAGSMTARELANTALLLLVAGHETTTNMIALGTLALLENPEQLALVRGTDDPARIAAAVEELLRYLTITHSGRRRVALADIDIGGRTIRAGEGVVVANDIGNRDPAVFADPDRLDVDRDARQ